MAKAKPSTPSTKAAASKPPAKAAAAAPAVKKPAVRAAKSAGNGEPAVKPQAVITMSHDEIAKRAYEIWLAKGRPMGQDEQNWREAEMDLRTSTRS